MKSKLAIAVRTIALRDYTVTCREDGRWIVTALPESDAPMLLIDAGTKADAYGRLVDHICKARRVAVRAVVAELKQLEA